MADSGPGRLKLPAVIWHTDEGGTNPVSLDGQACRMSGNEEDRMPAELPDRETVLKAVDLYMDKAWGGEPAVHVRSLLATLRDHQQRRGFPCRVVSVDRDMVVMMDRGGADGSANGRTLESRP